MPRVCDRAVTSGAILMASGRVPKNERIFMPTPFAFSCALRLCVLVLRCTRQGAGPVSARRRAGQAAKRCGIYGGVFGFLVDCCHLIENYRQFRENYGRLEELRGDGD